MTTSRKIKKKFFNNHISRQLLDIALKIEQLQENEINKNNKGFFTELSSVEEKVEEIEKKIKNILKGSENG